MDRVALASVELEEIHGAPKLSCCCITLASTLTSDVDGAASYSTIIERREGYAIHADVLF